VDTERNFSRFVLLRSAQFFAALHVGFQAVDRAQGEVVDLPFSNANCDGEEQAAIGRGRIKPMG
jgi:hypothetical protein